MKRNTTRGLPESRKDSLFTKHYNLLYMIHTLGNNMMLRKQIHTLFFALYHLSALETDIQIAKLIRAGMILQKQINTDGKTEMLYLNKYVMSRFIEKSSGNTPAIAFSRIRIFENIFTVEYLITELLPTMQSQNLELSVDNILRYLQWKGSSLLTTPNQLSYSQYFSFEDLS